LRAGLAVSAAGRQTEPADQIVFVGRAFSNSAAAVGEILDRIDARRTADDLPILSEAAACVYEILLAQPPHRGLTGPELLKKMDAKECCIDQSSLTGRIIPALKPYGVENAPRKGYRIPASKRPNRNVADT